MTGAEVILKASSLTSMVGVLAASWDPAGAFARKQPIHGLAKWLGLPLSMAEFQGQESKETEPGRSCSAYYGLALEIM